MEKEFSVSWNIYSLDVIQQAIADFVGVTEIVYKNDILTISGESEDEIQEVFHEFMNYVLSL